MPCYSPLKAFKTGDGSVVFSELRRFDIVSSLQLPCGQCIGCRLERSRQWAVRCMHEAALYRDNCFVTLTFSDEYLPERGSLDYTIFQKFMKRLRRRFFSSEIRFYMCGEYGEQLGRPHFHVCLFNFDFEDKIYDRKSPSGEKLYRSASLEALWPFGLSSVGAVTFESAAYVARYCVQKVTGKAADNHYERVDADTGEVYYLQPEFNHMSLKPGIGSGWLHKYMSDVFPRDYVTIRGNKCKPPKYYDRIYQDYHPDRFEEIQYSRELDASLRADDNTPERLKVKAQVAAARLRVSKRTI